jgi:uncharacterized protein YutE (UPF0331/DUF86 family)
MGKEKKKVGPLAWALQHRDEHNRMMRERQREIEEEAEEQELEAEELSRLLTATKKTSKDIAEVELPGGIGLKVYVDLTGEQEELMAMINTVALQAKRKEIPDMEMAIDAAVDLASSIIVPEDGRDWHKPEQWRKYHRMTDMERLLEMLGILLEPYKERCKKMAGFRKHKTGKKPRKPVQVLQETAEGTDEDD